MARLGRLLCKLAQDAPIGFVQRMQQAHAREAAQGRYPSNISVGPTAQQTAGFITPEQGVQESLVSALGPMGLLIGQLGMPFIKQLGQDVGVDFTKPYQYQYGGNLESFQEQQQVIDEFMTQQLVGRGEAARGILNKMVESVGKHTDLDLSGLNSVITNLPPQQVGMIVQQFAMNIPGVEAALSRVNPGFISDFQPFIKSTYMRNEGRFNPEDFRSSVAEFQKDYASGEYGQVPAQVAAHAVSYAMESMGPEATSKHARNIASAAHAYQQAGLAPTFGAAMQLATNIGGTTVANDPRKAIQHAAYLDDMARRGMVDKGQIYQAAEYASKSGVSVPAAMQAMTMGGRVRQQIGGKRGQRYADAAADVYAGLGKSTNIQTLASLWERDPSARKQIERAAAKGDVHRINYLMERARESRAYAQHKPDTSSFITHMSSLNPRMPEAFAGMDMRGYVKNLKNRELTKLLRNPKELSRRLSTSDFTGLSQETANQLSMQGQTGGRLAAMLSLGKDVGKSFRGGRLKVPKYKAPKTPSRIGMDYPTFEPPK